MKNYVVLSGNIASKITFKLNFCQFRLKQNNLNISCVCWKEDLIDEIKENCSQNDFIKILGVLKSNNYIKSNEIKYDYEIIITKIFTKENGYN